MESPPFLTKRERSDGRAREVLKIGWSGSQLGQSCPAVSASPAFADRLEFSLEDRNRAVCVSRGDQPDHAPEPRAERPVDDRPFRDPSAHWAASFLIARW